MNHQPNKAPRRLSLSLLMLAVLLLLALPVPVLAQGQSGSMDAEVIRSFLLIPVVIIATVVFFGMIALMLFAIFRYRRKSPDEMPEQVHGNTRLELGLMGVSFLIVGFLFVLTLGFYSLPREGFPEDPLRIEVVGNAWFWQFNYVESGITMNTAREEAPQENFRPPTVMRVPVGQPVLLEITSNDVIHSFWVPQLAGKVDAIPGRVQQMWFQVDEPRTYYGQCAEYCGLEHYNMLIRIEALPTEEYAAWESGQLEAIAEAQAGMSPVELYDQDLGDADAGRQLYELQGCTACHSLDGSVVVGPSYLGLGDAAAQRREGYTAPEYVLESIINPCEYLVEGFAACVMPQNYGDLFSNQDLANLIAFALSQ